MQKVRFIFKITLLLVLFLFQLTSCHTLRKMYKGEELPPSKIAILAREYGLHTIYFDGIECKYGDDKYRAWEIEPGIHIIVVWLNTAGQTVTIIESKDIVELSFYAKPGKFYAMSYKIESSKDWIPYIVESDEPLHYVNWPVLYIDDEKIKGKEIISTIISRKMRSWF
ncbi:MAG: hypothetical protein WCT77_03035 [Bacteroidota bacterium]